MGINEKYYLKVISEISYVKTQALSLSLLAWIYRKNSGEGPGVSCKYDGDIWTKELESCVKGNDTNRKTKQNKKFLNLLFLKKKLLSSNKVWKFSITPINTN